MRLRFHRTARRSTRPTRFAGHAWRSILSLLLAAAAAYAATATLFPTTTATSGVVTSATNALADDGAGALVSSNASSLILAGFDNTNLGAISDVTVWVKYRTTATPGNDSYTFTAALDGTTFTQTIVAASTADQPAYTTASLSLGAISWAQIGTLAVRCQTVRQGGADNYSVDWDVAYLVVTYGGNTAPSVAISTPANLSTIGGPIASYSITGTASDSDGTVTAVDVQIQRGTQYWNGSAWTGTAAWLGATGTTSWSYSWAVTNDMDATGVTVRARATDNGSAQTTATNTTTVDTQAPRIATGVRFQALPTSGDAAFTLLSDWTEANPGTPRFAYALNGGAYLAIVSGTAGNTSLHAFTLGLTGSDAFTGIKSDHTDTFLNGPTVSEDLGPIYVLPLTPNAPTVANNGTQTSLDVTVVANPGEGGTGMLYALRCHDNTGTPTGFWVANAGRQCTAAAADWQTLATWGSPVVVGGLSSGTTYGFSVAAGNPRDGTPTTGERSASVYGTTASATTSSANNPPSVTITSPTDGASFAQGATVTFVGTASDAEDGNLTAGLAWTSSLDGAIGSGGTFSRNDLSVGTHTITASVTDSGSLTGQDQISIMITAFVTALTTGAPSATIDSCNQITVQAPFTGDADADSSTLFERSPDGSTGWVAICSNVTGASPRSCIDATVADASINYYKVTFTDPDGVSGFNPQTIGSYDTTPYCSVTATTVNAPEAEGSSCSQITVLARFSGDGNQNGWTQVESSPAGAATWTTACAQLTGSSPRECLIPSLLESTAYDVRITYTDTDGVFAGTGTNPQTLASISTRACGADGVAPTVLFLSPTRGGTLTGIERVKVQVYDAVGATSVQWSVDQSGDTGLAATSVNANYDCGTNCAVYEFDLDTSGLLVGDHFATVKASDAAGNIARVSQAFRVTSVGGDGRLLRRSRGSQLCIDCHNLATHSSQSTSTKYGNWAVGCDACHTPHKTRNLFLLREQIETPNSDRRTVRFESRYGARKDTADLPGEASFANEDAGTTGTTVDAADGPCQVCHTRTRNPGDSKERWRNFSSGGNADNHFDDGRPTQVCTVCHSHSSGFSPAGGTCNACHNAPPTIGKHSNHDQVGTLPTSYVNLASSATAAQYGFACAKCHSGTHFSDISNLPHTVEVSFDATTDPKNGSGSYVASTFSVDPGNNGDGWNWSNGTCSNLYCHSRANRLGTNAFATVTWDQGAALTCTSCHDAGGASTTLSGAHAKHTNAGTYSFGCVRCHAATLTTGVNVITPAAIADKTQHVDGTRTLQFDTFGPNNSAGSYSQDPTYTCSNTYCHSNGQTKAPPYVSGPSIAWNTSEAADCTSCHAGNSGAASTMASGRHASHVNNTAVLGANYECATCHASTVTAGNDRAITGFSSHVDGLATVAGTLTDGSYGSSTCNNAYCHSSGQSTAVANFEYYAPTWDNSSTLDCKGCHGRHSSPAFTSVAGEPNYASGGAGTDTANSHSKHVTAASDCVKCHSETTSNGTSILASPGVHTNQVRDVVIAASFRTAGDGRTNYTPKTCNNIACHGAGTPQWGATLVCLDCHTGTEGGALGDGSPNAIDDQWTQATAGGGHGGTRGGTLTSGLGGCDYCHQLDASHAPTAATNPYRLRFSATDNTLCLRCHAKNDTGISQNSAGTALTARNSSKNVDTAHYGTKHDSTEGGHLCWDCHDPHGVPGNILMIKQAVSKFSDAYGRTSYQDPPGSTNNVGTTVTVTFTDNTTPGQALGRFTEASNTPRRGICQACHDPAGQGASGATKYWRSDGTDLATTPNPSVHNSAALCTNCHFHDANFKGAGGDCLGCHGTSGGAGTLGPNSRRPVQADFGRQSHHVGASVNATGAALFSQPTMGGALTNFDCVVCHAEGTRVTDSNAIATCTGAGTPLACCTESGTGTCETTDTNGQPHQDGIINLRNVDTTTAYFNYNKDQTGGIQTGTPTPSSWNSGTQAWREWTSGVDESGGATLPAASGDVLGAGLDRFCLSCHDSNGAVATYNSGVNENRGFSGSATNPFADSAITNEVDRVTRPAPTNIADMVAAGSCSSYPGVYCSQNSDCPGGTCNLFTANETGTPRGANAIPDPPDGIYSRHAIRGKSASVYTATTPSLDTATYWTNTTTWNSTSVMGCADCHTVDGANTTAGNAHGSGSEYLLKDSSGTANEGTDISGNYVCFQCHTASNYNDPSGHTGNNGNYVDTTAATGSARATGDGTIFGMPCHNCHGGAPGDQGTFQSPTTPEAASKGFGRIHGSSSIFYAGPNNRCVGGPTPGATCSRDRDCGTGGTCSASTTPRQAYRFMNGGGLRYYAPGTWTTASVSCYTLGAGDSWSNCSHHGTGTTFTKPVTRTLNY